MIKFLRFKKNKHTQYRSIIFRSKERYSSDMKERYIPKKLSLLIYGLDTSGKSKELNKIYDRSAELFNINNISFIFISFADSLAELIFKNIDTDDIKLYLLSLDDKTQIIAEQNISKQFIKIDALKYKAKRSFLFIDDIDKFTGKKLEILKDLVRNCKKLYATARENRTINKTIYSIIESKKFSSINLRTSNSFDVTNYVLVALMIPFAISGQYMIVMMLLLANRYLDRGLGK